MQITDTNSNSNDIIGSISSQLLDVLEKIKQGNFDVLELSEDDQGEEEIKFFQRMFDTEQVKLALHKDVDLFEDSSNADDYVLESAGHTIQVKDFLKVLKVPKDKLKGSEFIDLLYDVFGYLNVELENDISQ